MVVGNKVRLVAHEFCLKEGIVDEETFAPVAHLEAIRILLPLLLQRVLSFFKWMSKVPF